MTEKKYLEARAKVLSKKEDGTYTIGFQCPDCESGYITTDYITANEALTEGDIVTVKISAINKDQVITVSLYDEKKEVSAMPDLIKQAQEIGIYVEPERVVPPTGIGKYTVKAVLGDKAYRLQDSEDGKYFVGLAKEEMTIDTVATQGDFERIAEEHEMSEYTLLHHWWDNGKFEHWDLFMHDGEVTTHLVLETDPLKTTEIKAVQRQPYTEEFWLRGDEVEEIAPGESGNPSKEAGCSVERLDKGRVAVYESAPQADGSYLMRLEFFGTTLEGRWSFTSTVPNIWHALKETTKLTEQFPMDIELSGDIGNWEETPDGLEVTGTALSFGVWNGLYWSPDVIMSSPLDDFDHMIVDVEHDNTKEVGVVKAKEVNGPDVNVRFLVKDYETIQKIKNGEYKGLSIDAATFVDPVRRIVAGVKKYTRLTICHNPACKVCYFGS